MADVFVSEDVKELLNGKTILFIGDGNVRSLYKDLLWVSNHRKLIKSCCFSKNLSNSFSEDQLIMSEGEKSSWEYCEHRLYENSFRVELLYMNSLNLNFIKTFIQRFSAGRNAVPDLVYFSSAWPRGECGDEDFFRFFAYIMYSLKRTMKKNGQIVFGSSFSMCVDGFGDPLMEENIYLRSSPQSQQKMNWALTELAEKMGFLILDPGFYFSLSPFRGAAQNSRSERTSLRFLTNLFLTFCANLWGKKYPNRVDAYILRQAQLRSSDSVKEYLALTKANFSLPNTSNPSVCEEDDPAIKNLQCALKLIKECMVQQTKAAKRTTKTSCEIVDKSRKIEKIFEMPLNYWRANVKDRPSHEDRSENRFRKIDFTDIVDECNLLVLLNNNQEPSNNLKRQSLEPVQVANKRNCIRISPVETLDLRGSSGNSSSCAQKSERNSKKATAERAIEDKKPEIATVKENGTTAFVAEEENKDNILRTAANIPQPTNLLSNTVKESTQPDNESSDKKLIMTDKDTSIVNTAQLQVVTVKDMKLFQTPFKSRTDETVNPNVKIPLEENGKPSSLYNKCTLKRVSRFLGQLHLKVKEPNQILKKPKSEVTEVTPKTLNTPAQQTDANNLCEYRFQRREFVKNNNSSNLYQFPRGRRRRRIRKNSKFVERFNNLNFSDRFNNLNLGRFNNSNYPGRFKNSNLPGRYSNPNIPDQQWEEPAIFNHDSSRRYDFRVRRNKSETESQKVEEK